MELKNNILLSCNSYNNITVWFHDSLKSTPVGYSNDISMKQVRHDQDGTYYCYGLYESKKNHFLSKCKVKVYGEFRYMYLV